MWNRSSKCPRETCGYLKFLVKKKQLLLSIVGKAVSALLLMPQCPALWHVVRELPSPCALRLPSELPLVRVTSVMLSPLFWEGDHEH